MKVNWNFFSQNIMQCLLIRHVVRLRVSAVLLKIGLDVICFCVEESDEKCYLVFTKYSPFRLAFPSIPACIKELFQPEKLGANFPPKLR